MNRDQAATPHAGDPPLDIPLDDPPHQNPLDLQPTILHLQGPSAMPAHIFAYTATALSLTLVTFPLHGFPGNLAPAIIGLLFSITVNRKQRPALSEHASLLCSSAIGLLVALVLSGGLLFLSHYTQTYSSTQGPTHYLVQPALEAFYASLFVGISFGIVEGVSTRFIPTLQPCISTAIILASVMAVKHASTHILQAHSQEALLAALLTFVMTCFSTLLFARLGYISGPTLRSRLIFFSNLHPYLCKLLVPAGFALIVYTVIITLFAGAYATLDINAQGQAFKKDPPEPVLSLGNALYFALVTTATVGYGDIAPITPLAKALVSVNILVGSFWLVVVFAAIADYITHPRDSATSAT